MVTGLARTRDVLPSRPEERHVCRNAAGKWTINGVRLHITHDERFEVNGARRVARNNAAELPGFEQDEHVRSAGANQRDVADRPGESATVKAARISPFRGLGDETLTRLGMASGHPMSVRAMAYHVAGREPHHVQAIREKYL